MRGSIRHRAGAWRLQVYAGTDQHGRKQRVTRTVPGPDTKKGRAVAEHELARLVLEVEAGQIKVAHRLTVAELLERWQRARAADWSVKTANETAGMIRRYIAPHIGTRPIDKVRPVEIDALYALLLERGGTDGRPLASATVRRTHTVIHSAFAQAVVWDLIPTNPADRAKPPKVIQPEVEPPAVDLMQRALEVAREDIRLYAFLWLAATTGARRGSLCAVQWPDLDFERRTVTFSRALVDGGPNVGIHVKSNKGGKAYTAALDDETAAALLELKKLERERWFAAGEPTMQWVFVGTSQASPIRPDSASRWWRQHADAHGLEGVRFHDIRHFVATQMLGDGVDPVTVAKRLGWSSTNMLFTRYGHFIPERDREAVDRHAAKLRTIAPTADGAVVELHPD